MNNGLCPDCGCELDEREVPYFPDENGDPAMYGTVYTCPCCGYSEETYEA